MKEKVCFPKGYITIIIRPVDSGLKTQWKLKNSDKKNKDKMNKRNKENSTRKTKIEKENIYLCISIFKLSIIYIMFVNLSHKGY